MVHSVSRGCWLAAGAVGVVGLVVPACSSSFSSCEDARDCVVPSGGTGGEAGAPSRSDAAGSPSEGGSPSGQAGAGGDAAAGGSDNGDSNAGTSGTDEPVGGTGGGSPGDTVRPTILSITPVSGATQLTPATDKIVVTFSEPMNQVSAQAAYAPASAGTSPTFSWNAAGTVLTIDPMLAYPSATDPAAAATPFKFSVTTAAKDLAGNALAASVSWQFTLLREITQTFKSSTGSGSYEDQSGIVNVSLVVGDTPTNHAFRAFLRFDLSTLPAGIGTFESATLSAQEGGAPISDPFGTLGDLLIQSVLPAPISQAAFDAPALRDLGVFDPANGPHAVRQALSKDVLLPILDDYAGRVARNNASEYRLLFAIPTNSNSTADTTGLFPGSASLAVRYLYP